MRLANDYEAVALLPMWQYLLLVGAVLVLMPLLPVGSSRHYEAEAYAHKKDVCGADELVT